jgi:hypothetical protein
MPQGYLTIKPGKDILLLAAIAYTIADIMFFLTIIWLLPTQ